MQPQSGPTISVADLFAGCGGMTVGLIEAARELGCRPKISLAVDSDPAVISIYKANFQEAGALVADVGTLFDGEIGARPTSQEQKIVKNIGSVDVLVGGPPCQGHSDLNNHTRRNDPKNLLYLRAVRAAQILLPRVVIIENVATVHLDENGVVEQAKKALATCGYDVHGRVVDLRRVGVPQRRRRFLLVAARLATAAPEKILNLIEDRIPNHVDRTVRWAIQDLVLVSPSSAYDRPARTSDENTKRMDLLFDRNLYDLPNAFRPECHRDRDHSYVSMYGRLRWGASAQTITTGFGSMGQGRYVHPQRRRTLTPHEAARLQTFPDWFNFGEGTARSVLAKAIGNAVPPLLMRELGTLIIPEIIASRSVSVAS